MKPDPTEHNLIPAEGVSTLVDKNLNKAGTNKKVDDAAQLLGSQGSNKEQAGEDIKEAIQTTGTNGVEEELSGVGEKNEENATKVTRNQTGSAFDPASIIPEVEQNIGELRSELIAKIKSTDPKFDETTSTIGGRKVNELNQTEIDTLLQQTGSIEATNEEKEKNEFSTLSDQVSELDFSSVFNFTEVEKGESPKAPVAQNTDKVQELFEESQKDEGTNR